MHLLKLRPGSQILPLVGAGMLVLAGCTASDSPDSDGRLRVVTTTGIIGDIAREVGGEHVSVSSLMGPGIDPHLFKASAGDVTTLSRAQLILYNGLHLEAKMGDVLEQMDGRVTTVAVASGVDQSRLLSPSDYAGQYDPHIWFDVSLWMGAVERVRSALIEADPDNAEGYRSNGDRFLAELTELHEYVLQQAGMVPVEQRVLVTAHDAFNYFGRAYGFEVRGLQGISTASEAGTADVQGLSDFIVERGIRAIFVESSVSPRTIEAVQAAVQAKGGTVTIGGQLFSDALGTPGTGADSYVGMVRHNIDTIVSALRGSP
jgi:manganese/zinc/iron transport system substrate-binding protein